MGKVLSKNEALKYFLEGTLDSNAISNIISEEIHEGHDADDGSMSSEGTSLRPFCGTLLALSFFCMQELKKVTFLSGFHIYNLGL